jgi:6-phosphofructokinase
MVRAIPSNASDNVYCTLLAHSAIHGAMAGYCGFTAGPVNNRHCYIPIPRVTRTQRHVNVADRMWARLLSGTNQPDFLLYKVIIEEKRRAKALMQAEKMKKDAAEQTSKSSTTSPSKDSPTTVKSFNPTQFLQLIMTICSFFKMKCKLKRSE